MHSFFPLRKLSASLIFLLIAASPLLPVASAVAQPRTFATADIPFDFSVNSGGKLPAGRYEVVMLTGNLISLRSVTGGHVANAVVNEALAAALPEHGRLVFHRYGDQYFLGDIWLSGTHTGFQVMRSRAEKDSALTQAARGTTPGSEIALNANSH